MNTAAVLWLCFKAAVFCVAAGTRDRSRRPLLTVSTWNSVWSHPDCDSAELLRLLLYYISTLRYPAPHTSQVSCVLPLTSLPVYCRKETRASGLTVLVDACRAAPAPTLFSTLRLLQVRLSCTVINNQRRVHKDTRNPLREFVSDLRDQIRYLRCVLRWFKTVLRAALKV